MDYPLTLTHVLERSGLLFGKKEIASRMPDNSVHRYTYADFHARVHQLAGALARLGIKPGERVGSLCWNSYRHLELYFAVPCFGAVLHTLNLRLAPDQLAYLINHADNRAIFVDASLLPLLARIRDQIPGVKHIVIIPDTFYSGMAGAMDYEDLLAASENVRYPWPALDENDAAATCYTSGTTGNPKGVLYSHRSLVLHSFGLCMADSYAISARDTVLQIVPMFHANGWGIPFGAVMTGARIVLPGHHLQPADIAFLIESEGVTVSAAVPTIWMGLYSYLESNLHDISSLRRVFCAGSALPRQYIELYSRKYNLDIQLAWGMTETTPIATVTTLTREVEALPDRERFDVLARHGAPVAGVDVRITDAEGSALPWDGATMGELQVRGPWVTSGYYNDPRSAESFVEGWFRTGDVATIDQDGRIQILDRTKDLVKSGGEWISSVDLENAIMAHPKVMEAAVIGVFHPKWQERPLAIVAPKPEHRETLQKAEILAFLSSRVAKWWLPDDVIFVDAVPKTSVGKLNKRALREQFKEYQLPGI